LKFIKIFNEYVNNPEGYISLVIEYMQGFSLQDILENVGCLNESIICKMAIQIIQCYQEYNEKMGENYPELCTCDILFDKKGNLKV
jgi:serine/threonine protein kinase